MKRAWGDLAHKDQERERERERALVPSQAWIEHEEI